MANEIGNDYEQHLSDYRAFVRGTQIIVVVLLLILILMAIFLV